MADFQLVLPKMGESVIEATILTWHKKPGDAVLENEIVLEVATDKVDSEVPSPVSGVFKKILFDEGAVVEIGRAVAVIEIEGEAPLSPPEPAVEAAEEKPDTPKPVAAPKVEESKVEVVEKEIVPEKVEVPYQPIQVEEKTASVSTPSNGRFYSPLVLNIARTENISMTELEQIAGSGMEGRLTKEDVLTYLEKKKSGAILPKAATTKASPAPTSAPSKVVSSGGNELIEMDRMRKLIAKNMIDSRRISAHVSSFIEVDMTKIVRWREKNKNAFKKREGFNLTYMPIFAEAIAKAIKDYPMINISVEGDFIVKKKDINIGIATALPSGNLIVPVLKNADRMNLTGLAAGINQLADKARSNKLSPSDIEGGTYTISNIGSFGNILGTPIIPQPQVAIMAVGAITKKPVVLETPEGDVIAIRHMMYLSHTYDHRVVDGALGGMFVKRVAEYLEGFDDEQEV